MSPEPVTDLATDYLGLSLAHPVMASSSPLTGTVESLLHLEAAGASAVVLPSLFEEQIEHDAMAIHRGLEFGAEHYAEAAAATSPSSTPTTPVPTGTSRRWPARRRPCASR